MCRNDWTKWSDGACACCGSDGGGDEADPIRKSISYGPMPTLTSWFSGDWPETASELVNLETANCWLESRMRENRLYGSEGGGALTRSPYPHQARRWEVPGLGSRRGGLQFVIQDGEAVDGSGFDPQDERAKSDGQCALCLYGLRLSGGEVAFRPDPDAR